MSKEEEINQIHKNFISKLEKLYGSFDSSTNRFEKTSNSKVARDLFYSDSQFSRLVNNTASEGELVRALNNINRLLEVHHLKKVVGSTQKKSNFLSPKKLIILGLAFFGLLCLAAFYIFKTYNFNDRNIPSKEESRFEMLKWSFENKYIKPYVKLKELPEDCYYPCYKYQGKWKLKQEYKIPFFRERNGFHYVAKEVTMYARCIDEREDRGESFEGYEYQKHEIWYDKREFPIDSFLVKGSNTKVRDSYNNSHFEENDNFVKIAYLHTFFRTEFKIDSIFINRTGKAIGRDIEFVAPKNLLKQLGTIKLVDELKNEINSIAKNRLEDFSKPIVCESTNAPNIDFNSVKEGDEMAFDCQFSTGRFLVDYKKKYVLEDQYINNYCR
tara:strand:+ start:28011 stop:29162 length:1152 start_codon:yes stop_codon:yes gene_type:complete